MSVPCTLEDDSTAATVAMFASVIPETPFASDSLGRHGLHPTTPMSGAVNQTRYILHTGSQTVDPRRPSMDKLLTMCKERGIAGIYSKAARDGGRQWLHIYIYI
jgi:hypothetical protein